MDLNHLNLRVRDPAACRAFYERFFGFRFAFEADGGPFLRNDAGFLLALVPVREHQRLPDGFHIGFNLPAPADVLTLRLRLEAAGVSVGPLEDARPDESYVTFRCWDPDGTEIEVFWDGAAPGAR
jgi:catechol 2,3-dioxygenase-like lactoylglutathione lyase family enzyme